MRRQRRIQTALTLGVVFLGPVLVVGTFLLLGPMSRGGNSPALRLILLADLVYVLLVAVLVLARVLRMVADRRRKSAGSKLHLRLTGVFAGMALVPTVLVAVFAVLSVNLGLEGWFSERVRSVVGASLTAAQAYEGEQRLSLTEDAMAVARFLNAAREQSVYLRDDQLRPLLTKGQDAIQRGLKEAYLIDGTGTLMTRGDKSYLFDFEAVPPEAMARARLGGIALIGDWANNEFRAVTRLTAFPDRYLYVSRAVDGRLLSLLDETTQTVQLYNQLDADRGKLLLNFGLIYLGFALILILAAIWLGLWFAERLARPVGRLTSAAERVGAGDLDVQVPDSPGDDEIAMLGHIFNTMTRQLKGQRIDLMESHAHTEEQRRLFDSVLSNVTAGVMGIDPQGQVVIVNRAALRILDLELGQTGHIGEIVPEFLSLFEALQEESGTVAQQEVKLTRRGQIESLLVRMSERHSDARGLEGYVVAFDDVTDLVTAQRMAAWGDVARRIAHEIKNPLTPIALSAERLKRKFRTQVRDVAELESLTDVIVRQTNDLRRIVDEFSKFARMPEPDRRETDLLLLVRDAVTLQKAGQPDVQIDAEIPEGTMLMDLDATMISQALTNLIKNAGEATETYKENHPTAAEYRPNIRLRMASDDSESVIRIMDNGTGLPEDRARLFEPYVTTRVKGTGLGLPIVKKIIEEHGGTLALLDAPIFDGNAHRGAMAEIRLPRLAKRRMGRNIGPQGQGHAATLGATQAGPQGQGG